MAGFNSLFMTGMLPVTKEFNRQVVIVELKVDAEVFGRCLSH
jgi:hypothetical protein